MGFAEYRFPRYRASRHQRFVAEQLERVERGEIDRLMLFHAPTPREERSWLRIPTQSGQGFRFDVGHRSDLIPATIPK